ncbi:MAG TPA: hypothetical protein VLJ83_10345 [Gemmatimonadaceae bacterium]|nr:hypothetical protein [Gemmatimonadaceae bacterium]
MPEGRGGRQADDGRKRAAITLVTRARRASSQSMRHEPKNPRNPSSGTPHRSVASKVLAAALFLASPGPVAAQAGCKALPAARQAIERGWAAYRTNDIPAAAAEFKHALDVCPNDGGALTGAG